MTTDMKPTNPKDAIGSTKLPMHLVPSTVVTYAALGFTEVALKYGKFNWRVAGVRFSIYLDALDRHVAKLKNGEWADPVTQVPHLANIIACAGIIADAKLCGKLTDDRPPVAPMSAHIDELVPLIAHLKDLFKDHHPHQHTIQDEVNVETFAPLPFGSILKTPVSMFPECAPGSDEFQDKAPTLDELKLHDADEVLYVGEDFVARRREPAQAHPGHTSDQAFAARIAGYGTEDSNNG